jgi:hypothetical protein
MNSRDYFKMLPGGDERTLRYLLTRRELPAGENIEDRS